MNIKEFSATFDTLLNSYNDVKDFGNTSSNISIQLDEYEKSVLLTQAQDLIIKEYFNANLNQTGEGFDDSPRKQMDFSSLITVKLVEKLVAKAGEELPLAYDDRSILYKLPANILMILQEKAKVLEEGVNSSHVVIPIKYEEYDRLMAKPYAQPLKKQVWRLLQTNANELVELIPRNNVSIEEYKVRYLRRPRPIVLVDLAVGEYSEELNINGVSHVSECELNPIIHMDILLRAVEIAFNRRTLTTPTTSNNRQQ